MCEDMIRRVGMRRGVIRAKESYEITALSSVEEGHQLCIMPIFLQFATSYYFGCAVLLCCAMLLCYVDLIVMCTVCEKQDRSVL